MSEGKLARKGLPVSTPADIIKDPYVFEFLNFPELESYSEKDLEDQLVNKLAQFLLELGRGCASFVLHRFAVMCIVAIGLIVFNTR